ncbi:MAG TPA: AmmeMemoRadiSam system protein B [Candidatus Limnocylindrales bacterium]
MTTVRWRREDGPAIGAIRPPAVAGSFYPARPDRLRDLVTALLDEADGQADAAHGPNAEAAAPPCGLLVPHAGLVFSGLVAAAAWRRVDPRRRGGAPAGAAPATVVLLGTNHGAAWLDGVGVWEAGAWRTPLGDAEVDEDLATAIVGLGPPFTVERAAHLGEHSIEVQLPFVQALLPGTRIVPLAIATGRGAGAVAAGAALGGLLAERRATGDRLLLAISSDMAHYPAEAGCGWATAALLPSILDVDAFGLARSEQAVVDGGTPRLVCGMCGIEPAVVGLAALRTMGAGRGVRLADATSADAGGPADRTVGYLAVAFP